MKFVPTWKEREGYHLKQWFCLNKYVVLRSHGPDILTQWSAVKLKHLHFLSSPGHSVVQIYLQNKEDTEFLTPTPTQTD